MLISEVFQKNTITCETFKSLLTQLHMYLEYQVKNEIRGML